MCLALLAYKTHPLFPFVMAFNREEYYVRPTQKAHFWLDYPFLLAGRDLQDKGAWLGLTRHGYFAALTNYQEEVEPVLPVKKSRGALVRDFLANPSQLFSQELTSIAGDYAGFNLLFGEINRLHYFSNRHNQLVSLQPGLYGLSNHLLNTPWFKVKYGLECFTKLIQEKNTVDAFLEVMQDDTTPYSFNVDLNLRAQLEQSPIFVNYPTYGTRSSTVILVDKQGRVNFTEQQYEKNGVLADRLDFQFNVTSL